MFHPYWQDRGDNLEVAAEKILTGHTLEAYKASKPMISQFLDRFPQKLSCLDYGCGMGRCLNYLHSNRPEWDLWAFDNPAMLSRIHKVWPELPENAAKFEEKYELLFSHMRTLDLLHAELVIQHMTTDWFKVVWPRLLSKLTKREDMPAAIFVHTRRTLDDAETQVFEQIKDTAKVLEVWQADQRLSEEAAAELLAGGDSQDHFTLLMSPNA